MSIFYLLHPHFKLSASTILQVPPGVWEIFNTREICCGVHAPFSTVCETKGPNGRPIPSSAPTIALPEVSDTEEVALKFDLSGLPNDVNLSKLKANVLEALKIILAQLKERVPDLSVSKINERACYGRRLDKQRQLRMTERELRNVSICYIIEVLDRDNIQDFEALIVSEARASSDVVLDQIRTKLNYVNVGMYLAGISDGGGSGESNGNSGSGFDDGTIFINGGSGNGGSGGNPGTLTDEKSGIPGWAIALIVILLLILSCCIGYCIFVSVRDSKDDKYAVNVLFNNPVSRASNNRKGNHPGPQYKPAPPRRQRSFAAFARRTSPTKNVRDRPRRRDDGRRPSRSRYESFRSSFTGRAHRPSRSRGDRRDDNYPTISLSNPQDPKFGADAFTVNTYMTEKKSPQEPTVNAVVLYQPDSAKPDPSLYQPNNTRPDPSLYQPNNAKPDPEGETADAIVLALTNGNNTRKYIEEPTTKPKLEPEEVLLIEASPLDGSNTYRRSSSRTATLDPSVSGDDDFIDYGANDLYDKYEEFIFGRYEPMSQRKRSEAESSSLTTDDLEVEHERRQAKKKSRKKKKKQANRRDSSNSKKNYEEHSSTPESSERERVYKECSGVESVESGGEVRSIEQESRASA